MVFKKTLDMREEVVFLLAFAGKQAPVAIPTALNPDIFDEI